MRRSFLEIIVLFLLFALYGANAVPDVNEVYYVGKAIHFWQPDWIVGDEFLDGKDSHFFFYAVFGWLSFICSPTVMTWLGRCAAWLLLAWSWQRLSFTLIPVRYASVLTGLGLAYYTLNFHEAGEWGIGGVEGKSFAYPFAFFALTEMLRNRWERCILFLGIACAFHILIGGWATLIMAGLLLIQGRKRETGGRRKLPSATNLLPLTVIAFGFVLCGLIPALQLDAGTPSEIVKQAHQIYCFDRLQHHLVPYLFQPHLRWRFFLLVLIWGLLCRFGKSGNRRQRLFDNFIWGTLILYALGWLLASVLYGHKALSAETLRFYWFRWADIAVPMGVAIGSVRSFFQLFKRFYYKTDSTLVYFNGIVFYLETLVYLIAVYAATSLFCFSYCGLKADTAIPWAVLVFISGGVLTIVRRSAGTVLPKLEVSQQFIQVQNMLFYALFYSLVVYFVIAVYAPFTSLFPMIDARCKPAYPRSEPVGVNGAAVAPQWYELCGWIKENTPKDAKFWLPRDGTTFKWYARRADAGTWKNIPQDAVGIVRWREAMNDLFTYTNAEGTVCTDRLLTTLLATETEEQLLLRQKKYGFNYVICINVKEMPNKTILKLVYANETFSLYKIEK
ncbi:hypothetical protein FACS1894170_08270 [Planctomycetales bacterium]|nr:hypothetical protein FACS1894170_08270 [Planctomycetales bacterium]